MKTIVLFLMSLFVMTTVLSQNNISDPVEIKYHKVKKLLCKVPDDQREEFVEVLEDFANERGFDWRFILLLMWGESNINTKAVTRSFAGLIMFGPDARRILGVTKEELLQMNYVEQAKAAVKIWEANERMTKVKIHDFLSLQLSTFMPAWVSHHGNPYPASEIVKKQNFPMCDENWEITRESILNIYRKKSYSYEELKYFRGKF